MAIETIVHKFWARVKEHPDKLALRTRAGGAWKDITWRDYGDGVRERGKGLLALGLKQRRQDGAPFRQPPRVAHRRHRLHVDRTVPRHRSTSRTRPSRSSRTSRPLGVEGRVRREPRATREDPEDPRASFPALQKVIVFDGYTGRCRQGVRHDVGRVPEARREHRRRQVRRSRSSRSSPEDSRRSSTRRERPAPRRASC